MMSKVSDSGELHWVAAIEFVYFIERPYAHLGMFALWCGACLRGFPPGYGPIPTGAVLLTMDKRGHVPNYDLVIESTP